MNNLLHNSFLVKVSRDLNQDKSSCAEPYRGPGKVGRLKRAHKAD